MQFKYKKWLALGMLAVAMAVAGCAAKEETPGRDDSVQVTSVRQIVASDNKTARTIMWQSDLAQDYSVEYRKAGSSDVQQVNGENISFQDGKGNYITYRAALSGLEAGTAYEYRVNTAKNKGTWHKLNTDGGSGFTALIFPDSQSSDYSGWQKLARDAYDRNKDAALFVNMGDLVDNGEHDYQWNSWLRSVSTFSPDVPLAPVIGNHETYTLDWKMRMPEAYLHLFTTPDNGLEKYKGQFYSFDYGDVHFTVLDTNFSEMENFEPQLMADEKAWLEQDLANSKAKWKIILQHRDIMLYAFTDRPGVEHFIDVGTELMPIFEKYNVDAVLTAHLHTYRRRVPLRNFAPDPNGIPYILTGVAGDVRYAHIWQKSKLDAKGAPQPETANYMTLHADNAQLVFKAFLPDGTQFDEYTITK